MSKQQKGEINSPKVPGKAGNTQKKGKGSIPRSYSNDKIDNQYITDILTEESRRSVLELTDNALSSSNFSGITSMNSREVLIEIQNRRRESAHEGNFEEAKLCDLAVREIIEKNSQLNIHYLQQSADDELREKIEMTTADLEYLKKYWEIILEKVNEAREVDFQLQLAENEKVMSELKEKFKQDPPESYQKYSNKVMDMRERIDELTKEHEYKQVDLLKRELEKLELLERQGWRMEWTKYGRSFMSETERKQEEEMENKKLKWENDIAMLNNRAEREIEDAEKYVQILREKMGGLGGDLLQLSFGSTTPKSTKGKGRNDGYDPSAVYRQKKVEKHATPKAKRF